MANSGDLEKYRERAFMIQTAGTKLTLVAESVEEKRAWMLGVNTIVERRDALESTAAAAKLQGKEPEQVEPEPDRHASARAIA